MPKNPGPPVGDKAALDKSLLNAGILSCEPYLPKTFAVLEQKSKFDLNTRNKLKG